MRDPFNFEPQDMRPRRSSSSKRTSRAPAPLPAFSFPQAPDPVPSPKLVPGGQFSFGNQQPGPEPSNNGESVPNPPPVTVNNSLPAPAPPGLPNPGPGLSGRGPGRRGHAHRRSAAISSVDLTAITKAFPPKTLNGSSPSTPVELKKLQLGNGANKDLNSPSFPSTGSSYKTPPLAPRKSAELLAVPSLSPKATLGPAPTAHRSLSTISSESSASTIRPSVSHVADKSVSQKKSPSRPKSAGPFVDSTEGNEDNQNSRRPRTASALVGIPDNAPKIPELPPNISKHDKQPSGQSSQQRASTGKSSKKQKKMRTWAGILSRKSKKRSSKRSPSRKAPTPPPILSRTNSELGSVCGVNFDEDNTIVIRTPTHPDAPRRSLPSAWPNEPNDEMSLETAWKPQSFYDQGRDLDMFSPVIDLDAALGPFNTPEMGPDHKVTSFSAATRRMYSGGRRGEFIGPEMRYHRRTESAPEMPPFDRNSLGLGRFGASAMEIPDVFDEKEEDEFLAGSSQAETEGPDAAESTRGRPQPSEEQPNPKKIKHSHEDDSNKLNSGLGIQIVDAADEFPHSNREHGTSAHFPKTPSTPNLDVSGLTHSLQRNTAQDIEIVDTDQLAVLPEQLPARSPPPPQDEKRPTTSASLAHNNFQTPLPPNVVASVSESPSPAPSSTSFDAPRLNTASSSITDRKTFGSVYSGEPGSECLQGSVDDVPSLTSSASTVTGTIPRLSAFYSRATGDRSASFSAHTERPVTSASAKRSSLVSLSKLVGVASSEKSKLRYEEKAPTDEPDKKKKKGHRISRLMSFLKTKEKDNQTATR